MSGLRIIAGEHRRRRLRVPGGDLTRPSSDRVRESIYNMISARLELDGIRVLDLFAGTGALGLEALSRGAGSCIFVERHPLVLAACRDNAVALEIDDRCTFQRADVFQFLSAYTGPAFDLILADPPYDLNAVRDLPKLTIKNVSAHGLFVLEHDRDVSFASHHGLETTKSYGRTSVSIFTTRAE